jgi:hypothetical protein
MVFEKRVLRKISGPKTDEVTRGWKCADVKNVGVLPPFPHAPFPLTLHFPQSHFLITARGLA